MSTLERVYVKVLTIALQMVVSNWKPEGFSVWIVK